MKLPFHSPKIVKELTLFAKKSKSGNILIPEILTGTIIIIILLSIFFQLATLVFNKDVIVFDESIITLLYSLRSPFLTQIMSIFTFFGGEIFVGSTIIAIIFYLIKRHTLYAYLFAFILFSGIGLNLFLKDIFERPRPFLDPLVFEATYSFPSGHSMNSFIFYTTIVYFVYRHTKSKKIGMVLYLLCTLLIISIGVSRVYLGAHYPSDVLAGWIAGFCWFASVLLFEKILAIRNLYKTYKKSSTKQYSRKT